MAKLVFIDAPQHHAQLLPLTYTRAIADCRVGILTIAEGWQLATHLGVSYYTLPYLQGLYPVPDGHDMMLINGGLLYNPLLWAAMEQLQLGQALVANHQLLAAKTNQALEVSSLDLANYQSIAFEGTYNLVAYPEDIFKYCPSQIAIDFELVKGKRSSAPITDPFTKVYNPEQVFVEEGAVILAAILNASEGPIYIGRDAQVQEGSMIKGPFALGDHAVVNMGGKMRGNSSIGPYCKVGGEVSSSVLFGFSNKGHDGFLGNSVLGQWCNLGADTNTSNLKNNYGNVAIHDFSLGKARDTGSQFVGTIMGDHSKTSINTMLNTGTVVGVGCNVFDGGFPPKLVPNFSWGGAQGFEPHQIDKMLATERKVMARRKQELSPAYEAVLRGLAG